MKSESGQFEFLIKIYERRKLNYSKSDSQKYKMSKSLKYEDRKIILDEIILSPKNQK